MEECIVGIKDKKSVIDNVSLLNILLTSVAPNGFPEKVK